jgi:hypothetical protein
MEGSITEDDATVASDHCHVEEAMLVRVVQLMKHQKRVPPTLSI